MTVSSNLKLVGVALLCIVTFLASGCSRDKYPKRYTVTGTVSFPDGDPVQTGVVEFIPLDGNLTANGNIQRDGTYSLSTIANNDGAVPGNYKVVVKQFIFYDKIPEEKHDHGGDVSTKFADEKSTPLTFTVEAKKNTADFEVQYRRK